MCAPRESLHTNADLNHQINIGLTALLYRSIIWVLREFFQFIKKNSSFVNFSAKFTKFCCLRYWVTTVTFFIIAKKTTAYFIFIKEARLVVDMTSANTSFFFFQIISLSLKKKHLISCICEHWEEIVVLLTSVPCSFV